MSGLTRVFHLIKGLGRGGAETLLSEGLGHADRAEFEYGYGYFIPWKDALVPSLREQGAEVVCFDKPRGASIVLSARQVAKFVNEWRADILHCHLPLSGVAGRLAGRIAGVPVVYTEHNKLERYHSFTRYANLLTWGMQSTVVAVSNEVAGSIRRHSRSSTPVQIVLNGIDTARFTNDPATSRRLRDELGVPARAPIVGTVAVFRRQKRLDLWLRAARLLLDEHPDVHFVLVGDGPLRREIEMLNNALALTDSVHFVGLKPDVRPYLAVMDIFMTSSAVEGLPLALLEAMAMRRPAVATAVGGVPEVIQHGVNGFLVEPGDPKVLAEQVSRVLSSLESQTDLIERGRQTVEERFGIARMVRNLEDIYRAVLESGNGAK